LTAGTRRFQSHASAGCWTSVVLVCTTQPKGISDEDLVLMKLIDRQYLATPFYGARKIAACLKSHGNLVNRKRVQRLMRLMGI